MIDYYRSSRPTENLPEWIEQIVSDKVETVRRELSSCLEPMIKQLPDKYREAVHLSEIERKTQKDVSEMQNISLSGAKSRVQRGRALLKTMLHDCCELEFNQNNHLISYKKKERNSKFC